MLQIVRPFQMIAHSKDHLASLFIDADHINGVDLFDGQFLRLCSDPTSELATLRDSSRRLYDWLIAPVRQRLSSDRTLVIESDDLISGVPVQSLIGPDGRYLAELFPVVVSLGLVYDRRLRGDPSPNTFDHALIVGGPTMSGELARGLAPVQDTVTEAQAVAKRFVQPSLLIGNLTMLERVQQELANSSLFHFAGHSISTSQRSGLSLAGTVSSDHLSTNASVVLEVAELHSAALKRCRLIVLSACATAQRGEETLYDRKNLVRAFLSAGVPHMIASRWNVDSQTTATLMDSFYAALLSGKTVAQSMQIAEGQVRQQPSTRHPYFGPDSVLSVGSRSLLETRKENMSHLNRFSPRYRPKQLRIVISEGLSPERWVWSFGIPTWNC